MKDCAICNSWNPWHHPYTVHCAWCPEYAQESAEAKAKNAAYHKAGGYYQLGYPSDGILAS